MKSAAVASAGAVAGLGVLSQFSRGVAAAGSSRLGAWSSGLSPWPLIPLHAVLLGDGRLLTYGTNGSGQPTGYFIYDVWTPPGLGQNSHMTLPNNTATDIFCSAQIVLPQNGNVLIAGGDNWTGTSVTNTGVNNSNIFYPGVNTLGQDAKPMIRPRWYASPTTLPDGKIYIQGGRSELNVPEHVPEIRDPNGGYSLLTGINTGSVDWFYPRNRVAPNGLLFGYSDRGMYYVNPNGSGSFTFVGTMPSDGPSGLTSTDVMYAPGKILRCGGGSNSIPEQGGSTTPAKNAAAVIDINGATPTYKKMPSMPLNLHWANATVIADGNVVVTGGSAVPNELNGMNTSALLWKADTGSWTQGAQSAPGVARLYHSIALLLPDASVLVGGGGGPGPQTNLNVQIYYPPYLFTNSGAPALKPQITSSPGRISYGQNFLVGIGQGAAIQRVTFIKTASVTHSCNFEQRFMELSFTPSAGGVSVQAPSSAALAPPGYYLLFAFNSQGTPSDAKIVQIGS